MPLVQIRRKPSRISDGVITAITETLPANAAQALTCKEGGVLAPKDIMIEVDDLGPLSVNNKDINIRVFAHDYPARRGDNLETLDAIRKQIAEEVLKHLPDGVSWYVWVILAPTSYGSDTEG